MSYLHDISDVPNVVIADENTSRLHSAKTIAGLDLEKEPASDAKGVDVPPNGGYGWVCVACVFWINAHTWGFNSVGPFTLCINPSNFKMTDSIQGLWRFSCILPGEQLLSRCISFKVCFCRRVLHLNIFSHLTSRNLLNSRLWHKNHSAHWNIPRDTCFNRCVLLAQDVALVS